MAKQTLNFGNTANDGTGDALRDGGLKIQANFDELYAAGNFVKPADMTSATINAAISDAQSDGARLVLPAGNYTLGGGLVTWNGSGTVGPAQGFALKGAGKLHNFASQYGGTAMGTILRLSNGAKVDTNGARSVVFEDLAIIGSNDDVLLDAENGFENGGGLRRVYLENQSTAIGAAVIRTGAMFTSHSHHADIVGRSDYRARYSNNALNSDQLFNTHGFEMNGTGKGSGGVPDGWNLHGHGIALKLGVDRTTYAAGSPTPWAAYKIENWMMRGTQMSYNEIGALVQAGFVQMVLEDPHFEYNTLAHVIANQGAGNVVIKGGQSNNITRANGQRMRDASFVAGAANDADGQFKQFLLDGHNLSYIFTLGVLAYGGSQAGEVILKDCFANFNNGILVGLADANGIPDVLIDGFKGKAEHQHSDFPVNSFVRRIVPSTGYGAPANAGDGRWLCRIQNSGVYGEGIVLGGDLDFTQQKYAPVSCTVAAARTVTLGNRPPIGWPTTLRKTGGTISLVVPNGTALYHAGTQHTAAAGSSTVSLTANGTYELTRLDAGIWTCEGVSI